MSGFNGIHDKDEKLISNNNPFPCKIGDMEGNIVEIDTLTNSNAFLNIPIEHHKIHEGNHYFLRTYGTLNNGSSTDIVGVIDANTILHTKFDVNSTDSVIVELYEGITGVTGGETFIPLNNNRNSTNTSTTGILFNPNITDIGTLIWSASVGSKNQTGTYEIDEELLLKKGTSYLWRITSATNGNVITYHTKWYEVYD